MSEKNTQEEYDMLPEDEQDLYELDKKTLGSYVKKATKNIQSRATDLARAGNMLSMDPEMMDKTQKFKNKTQKRIASIDRAVDKLTKEEYDMLPEDEQDLYELDKKTLGSYVGKAVDDIKDAQRDISTNIATGTRDFMRTKDYKDLARKRSNRTKGIGKAIVRMTKEEYDDLPEDEQDMYELEEVSYERDLKDHEPRIVQGVKGMKNSPFKKRFPHQKAMEKWMDSDDYDNHTVHRIMKEETELEEASIAAATLRPGSRTEADPKSKIEFMQRTLGAMNGMKKEDLSKWFNQAMALIGKEADSLPSGANYGANQNSIDMKTGKGPKTRDAMPKLSVKEDVEEMFEGQDLSEEFKENASTIFEAAVTARAALEIARLDEEYETRLEESVTEIVEELQTNLDSYLSYVAEKWMNENEVAIESALRNEIMEEFIGGLKGLFVEHYIDIPEEKVSVVESLASKIEALESALDEQITENAELKTMVLESNKQEILDELAEGLTMSQAEKFFALAEGVHFDGDLDVYAKKLSVVKENYFTRKSAAVMNLEEETFETGEPTNTVSVDPSVNRYVQAISRTVKK